MTRTQTLRRFELRKQLSRPVLAGAAVLLVAAAFAATAFGHTTHAVKSQKVTVTATEFKFAFSPKAVHPGSVTFHVVNKGHVVHDFKIAGKSSARIAAGKSTNLTVTLKAGKYPYSCTIPGHAAAGMKGTLQVK
jgi:uncharacterized cupredoxin-like copper-binding protein